MYSDHWLILKFCSMSRINGNCCLNGNTLLTKTPLGDKIKEKWERDLQVAITEAEWLRFRKFNNSCEIRIEENRF